MAMCSKTKVNYMIVLNELNYMIDPNDLRLR